MEELKDEIKFYIKDNISEEYKENLIYRFLNISRERKKPTYTILLPHLKTRIPFWLKKEMLKYAKGNTQIYEIDIEDENIDSVSDKIVRKARSGQNITLVGNGNRLTIAGNDVVNALQGNDVASSSSTLMNMLKPLGSVVRDLAPTLLLTGMKYFGSPMLAYTASVIMNRYKDNIPSYNSVVGMLKGDSLNAEAIEAMETEAPVLQNEEQLGNFAEAPIVMETNKAAEDQSYFSKPTYDFMSTVIPSILLYQQSKIVNKRVNHN